MKWLKKKFYKWFFNDDIDEEYEEYDNEEEWQNTTYEQNELEQKRTRFRFPLIADEELKDTTIESTTNHDFKSFNQPLMNNQTPKPIDSQVYDVEVPRIAELLEMRRQKKNVSRNNVSALAKRQNEIARNRELKKDPLPRELKKDPLPKERQSIQENQQPKVQEKNIPQNRKRFIPTDVPSPVFGFQKRHSINELKTEQQEEQTKAEKEEKELSLIVNNEEKVIASAVENKEDISPEVVISETEVAATSIIDEIDKKLEQVKEEVQQIIHQPLAKLSITIEGDAQENTLESKDEKNTITMEEAVEKERENAMTVEQPEAVEAIQTVQNALLHDEIHESTAELGSTFTTNIQQENIQKEVSQVDTEKMLNENNTNNQEILLLDIEKEMPQVEKVEEISEHEEKLSNETDFNDQEIIQLEDIEEETTQLEKVEEVAESEEKATSETDSIDQETILLEAIDVETPQVNDKIEINECTQHTMNELDIEEPILQEDMGEEALIVEQCEHVEERSEYIEKALYDEETESMPPIVEIQNEQIITALEKEQSIDGISFEEHEMENQPPIVNGDRENSSSSEEMFNQNHNQKVMPSRERIVPFNVVMLKSDKEKLAKKLLAEKLKLEAQAKSKKTINSFQTIEPVQDIKSIQTGEGTKQVLFTHEEEAIQQFASTCEVEAIQMVESTQKIEPTQQAETLHDGEPIEKVEGTKAVETIQVETIHEFKPIQQNESIQKDEPIQETEPIEQENSIQELELVQGTESSEQATSNQEPKLTKEPIQEVQEKKVYRYVKPPLEYLTPPEEAIEDREWMERQADVLVEALSYFQVTANVESIMQGPAVTQFEITVGHGTKVSKIRNLADDLKLALAAKDIRIQAPIPGKSTIGIEIPNRISRPVRLSEVVNSEAFLQSESPLEAALGLDLTGKPVTIDLRKMPHGLIAGATGSGKSVCINSLLVSLLLKAEPNELKLMLIDPKMVELAPFNHIPHLVSPVITDVKAANAALKWAVDEMERRYQLFAHAGVRDLPRYNQLVEREGKYSLKLPYILIVIDELADLMMMAPQDVEESICRIAQKARACGIHLIIATQRPSVDVITGLIKSNIPTRIAFAVSSQIDSRTILDSQGAERLLGRGDMLYVGNGMTDPIRLQGTFVTDDEIDLIIEHVKEQGEPDYFFEQEELLKKAEMNEEHDELFEDVCRFVYEQGSVSASLIQRKYHIGYNRAARLIEALENYGFISEQKGSKPRDVYITEADLAEMFD